MLVWSFQVNKLVKDVKKELNNVESVEIEIKQIDSVFFIYNLIASGWLLLSGATKVTKKALQKIFQSYFLLSKPTYPDKSGRATSLVREEFSPDKGSCSAELVGFVSTQSDREKFLADALFCGGIF